ncbi:MAG: hypothetical protein NVS1B10_01550 [Candidatus Saccharimonadales bacterium]
MSFIHALDVSQYQGNIDWNAVRNAGYEIAIIKVSGGDNGTYVDTKAGANYAGARAAGLAVGTYHFAGGTDPVHEAEYFVNVCSPVDPQQVLVLDWEVQHPDPVGWCTTFVNRVHELTSVWPLVYFNGSTWNGHDWSRVTNNCGVWVAWYGQDPNVDLPVHGTYVMHQYTSDGAVPGIAGRVDLDAWYGSVEQFKMYGLQTTAPAPVVTPPPIVTPPVPEPVVAPPAPVEPPSPTPPPVLVPPAPEPPKETPKPVETPRVIPPLAYPPVVKQPKAKNWLQQVIDAVLRFFDFKV